MKIYNKIFVGFNVVLLIIVLGLVFAKFNYKEVKVFLSSEQNEDPIKIMAVGDMMLGRHIERLMTSQGEMYPFSYFKNFDLEQDVIIGNLEGPIPAVHTPTLDFTTNFSFKPSVAPLLKNIGFTHLTLANNHTLDKGEAAFWNTKKVLEEAGIKVFGNPSVINKDWVYKEQIKGRDLAWIGASEAVSKYFKPEEIIETVKALKAENEDVFVILNIHWGTEYQLTSNTKQKELARQFINSGVDLILGHHPHVTQEVEVYKNRLIFYSLGNFVFDQYFSKDTQEGLAVYLQIENSRMQAILEPVISNKSRPAPMNSENGQLFLNKLAEHSSADIREMIQQNKLIINF